MIELNVDGKLVQAEEGKSLLQVCLENGIYVPNLCFLEEMTNPPVSCRLCFVEIRGKKDPVPSCKIHPEAGMEVVTDSPRVRRLQRTALRLLLSAHRADCRKCPSNRHCELQHMVRFLGGVRLKPRRYENLARELPPGEEHPVLEYRLHRCVLCGRCIYVCGKLHGMSLLTFAKRGFNTIVSAFGEEETGLRCLQCRACVEICPVSALAIKEAPPAVSNLDTS